MLQFLIKFQKYKNNLADNIYLLINFQLIIDYYSLLQLIIDYFYNSTKITILLTLRVDESAHQSETLSSLLGSDTSKIGFSLNGKSVDHITPDLSVQPLNK